MKINLSEKDKHPILKVMVDGVKLPLNAMIDTGASCNYFFLGDARPEEFPFFKLIDKVGIADAPGVGKTQHKIILHKIKIDEWNFELEFGLLQGTFYGCHLVLGTRFLYDNKISLYIKDDYFILKKEEDNEIILAESSQ